MNNPNDQERDEVLAIAETNERNREFTPPSMNDLRRSLAHKPIDNFEAYLNFTVRLAALGTRETWQTTGDFLENLLALRDLKEHAITLLSDLVGTCF